MICVSLVCGCPFILLPLTEGWMLVGDCCVRGSMYAEAFRFHDVDELPCRHDELVRPLRDVEIPLIEMSHF